MNNTEEIKDDDFQIIGKQLEQMESISRPALSYWEDAWRRIKKNRIAFFSLVLLGIYVLLAVFVPIFSPYDYAQQNSANLSAGISVQNWFGTDSLGRDLFVRVWMGGKSISDHWFFCGTS